MMAIPEGAWNNPPEPEPARECGTCRMWEPCEGCGEDGVCELRTDWRAHVLDWRGEHGACRLWCEA